ncbi:MAG: type III-B CRISPR-associated protein Cas10/Cmr2, partial [bacterium]
SSEGEVTPSQLTEDRLVRWAGGERNGEAPRVGSVPNHFAAVARDAEHAREIARAAEVALQQAWRRVCDAVWNRFIAVSEKYVVAAETLGAGTRAIWDRQIAWFWEIVWVAGQNAPELLARRKLWRTHWPPEEPGDKCSVMPGYQELSGYVRARDREAQDAFWDAVRQRSGSLDLGDGERLCAMALVKRLYARCSEESIGWKLDTSAWPSTVDFAALPWLRKISQHPEACARARTYTDLVIRNAPDEAREGARHFRGLANCGEFAQLNGNYHHPTSLANPRVTPLRDEAARERLKEVLKAISKIRNGSGRELGYPPVYYAMLLGDGDRLGSLIRDHGSSAKARIASALDLFAREAATLSEDSDAVRVYAGGDDVFAMLPVNGALEYADKLASKYAECFAQEFPQATLSAAVLFAHMTTPLTRVLVEVRRLLDDVAKEQNGRDSLAVGVYRRSGPAVEWVTTWNRHGARAIPALNRFIENLRQDLDADVSAGVIYRLHSLLSRLLGAKPWKPGTWIAVSGDVDIPALIRAEIVHSLEKRAQGEAEIQRRAEMAAAGIWNLLRAASNNPKCERMISTDVLLLARFLANGGQEEKHL